MNGRPYTRRERAAMSRRQGTSYATIAKRLKVSDTTVRRWLNPEYKRVQDEISARRKARMQGVCEDCGGPTKHNSRQPTRVSKVCASCQHKRLAVFGRATRFWTEEKIIAAIARWVLIHGEPPKSEDWARRKPTFPGRTTVIKRFGSWNRAISAAGFKPRPADIRGMQALWKLQEGEDH